MSENRVVKLSASEERQVTGRGDIRVRETNFGCSPNIVQDEQVEEGEMVEVCSSYDRTRQEHTVAKTFGKQGMGGEQQSRHRSNRMY